jgi:hypothetical protein
MPSFADKRATRQIGVFAKLSGLLHFGLLISLDFLLRDPKGQGVKMNASN